MANINVPTTPPGVWPVATTAVDETVYAVVEADVLRRKPGQLLEGTDARDAADMVLRAGHTRPKITVQPTDETVILGDTDAVFAITVTGSPTPEVTWEVNQGDGNWATAGTGASLTIDKDEATLDMDGWEYRATVRNYKGTVISEVVVLTAEEAE